MEGPRAARPEASRPTAFKDFYQFTSPTRVVAGRELISGAGFEFGKEGARRVLVVTDRGVRATGLLDRAIAGLRDGGLELAGVFDDVPQDSDVRIVERCAAVGTEAGADSFLALGGGSVMDTAKAADAIFPRGGSVRDDEGLYALPRRDGGMGPPLALAPLACIPTTAGTGSEASPVAVVKDHGTKVKIELADLPLFPRLAILDPEATRTLPPAVAAATGMDALTHAVEAYVCTEWNPHADAAALQAARLIRDNLPRAVQEPTDDEARGNMLIAASLAVLPSGSAAFFGIAHSMSHACGAQYGVPHGVANAINLPHAIRYNAAGGPETASRYAELAQLLDAEESSEPGEALARYVTELARSLGLPTRLSSVGVPESGIPALVDAALGDGCTLVNPREPTGDELAELFRAAL